MRWNAGKGEPDYLTGTFIRWSDGEISMDPDLFVDFFVRSSLRDFKASVRPCQTECGLPRWSCRQIGSSADFSTSDLRKWEKEQGGFLEIIWDVQINWRHYNRTSYCHRLLTKHGSLCTQTQRSRGLPAKLPKRRKSRLERTD